MSSPTTRSEEQPMSNPGMDADVFAQFIEQLQRYVRERLLPAEKEIVETDRIPDDILAAMRDMGLFGLTIPETFGGADRTRVGKGKSVSVRSDLGGRSCIKKKIKNN